MRAELKYIHSPDVPNLENYQPENEKEFAFLIQAMIGPEGAAGEESFDILVCTPAWLEKSIDIDEVLIARHHIIVRQYDYHKILNCIENFLKDCSGQNWNEIALKVSRLGKWEFEDYQI